MGGSTGQDAGVTAWADMDRSQRQAYMAQTVSPQMQTLFGDFDPAYAEGFSCATCHGSDLTDFAMPSDITPLSGAELASFTFEGDGRQAIADFMAQQVVPQMAELLGQEPFDPATNTGSFGCASCHAIN